MKITEYVEITDETRTLEDGVVVHRIRAIKDFPFHGITTGDWGGWIQNANSIHDAAWVGGNAILRDNAQIFQNVLVDHNAVMRDNTRAQGYACIINNAQMNDWAYATQFAAITGNTVMSGGTSALGNCYLSGDTRLDGGAVIRDSAALRDCQISNNVVIDKNIRLINVTLDNQSQLIFGTVQTSVQMEYTAWRATNKDGAIEMRGKMGCWTGTADQLLALAESDTWIDTRPDDIPTYRPELLAVAHQWLARQERLRTIA